MPRPAGPPVRRLAPLLAVLIVLAGAAFVILRPSATGPLGQPPSALSVPTTLTAVDLVSPGVGWAAGYTASSGDGAIYSTTDGGLRWLTDPLPHDHVLALSMTGQTSGFALVESGCAAYSCSQLAILETQTGKTWSVRWRQPLTGALVANLAQLSGASLIVHGRSGWALVGGLVLHSQNSGQSWQPVTLRSALTPTSLSVVEGTAVLALSSPPTATSQQLAVWASQNGGQSWQTLYTASPPGGLFPYSVGVSFANAEDGWLYYKNNSTWQAFLLATTNGGRSWSAIPGAPGSGRTVSLAPDFVSANLGWLPVSEGAAPFPGGLYVTHNGGRSWSGVGTSFQNPWSLGAVSLLPDGQGWAIISESSGPSVLATTANGGQSWRELLPALRPTAGIVFSSPEVGVGIGSPIDSGAVLMTHDGGLAWTEVASLPAQLTAVSSQPGLVLVSGQDAQLANRVVFYRGEGSPLRFHLTFQMAVPAVDFPAAAPVLQFFSTQRGLWKVFGFPEDVVLGTTDGGSRWQPVAAFARSPGTWDALQYLSPSEAVLAIQQSASPVNAAGTDFPVSLSASTDGGSSFVVINQLQLPGWLQGVDFLSPQQGWLLVEGAPLSAHPSELLYSTKDGGTSWQAHPLHLAPALLPLAGLGASQIAAIDFVSSQDGFILAGNALLRTRDGGLNWQAVP